MLMKDSRKKKTDIFASTVESGFLFYAYTRSPRSIQVPEDMLESTKTNLLLMICLMNWCQHFEIQIKEIKACKEYTSMAWTEKDTQINEEWINLICWKTIGEGS